MIIELLGFGYTQLFFLKNTSKEAEILFISTILFESLESDTYQVKLTNDIVDNTTIIDIVITSSNTVNQLYFLIFIRINLIIILP